jgi:hypothetical protein
LWNRTCDNLCNFESLALDQHLWIGVGTHYAPS